MRATKNLQEGRQQHIDINQSKRLGNLAGDAVSIGYEVVCEGIREMFI